MKNEIEHLLSLPIWQMTGREYVALHHYAAQHDGTEESKGIIKKTGVRQLASYLDCCESTLYSLKREGVLDKAVISRIGKNIVFDAEKARTLADEYKKAQRSHYKR